MCGLRKQEKSKVWPKVRFVSYIGKDGWRSQGVSSLIAFLLPVSFILARFSVDGTSEAAAPLHADAPHVGNM